MKKALKKRILILICLLICVLSFWACNGGQFPQQPSETDTTETSDAMNEDIQTNESTVETTGENESTEQETEDTDLCENGHTYVDSVCTVCGMKKPSEGLAYSFDEEQQGYIVTGIGTCSDTEVVIPNTHENFPVIAIGETAFRGCQEMKSISIPNSVKSIGDSAFFFCTQLSQIEFLGGGIQFQGDVFGAVPALKRVLIMSIEDWFSNSGSYDAFTSGADLYLKGERVTDLIIPDGITEIPDHAFYNCTSITNVTIPAEVISIGAYSFGFNRDLESGSHLSNVTLAPNSQLTVIGDSAFSCCTNLVDFAIPEGVTEIGNYAFARCSLLKSISIPKKMEKIGRDVFSGSGLEKIYITDLSAWCNINFSLSANVLSNGVKLYLNGECVTDLIIPNDVKAINTGAFSDYDALISVVVPERVETIGGSAFYGCDQLERVKFEGEGNIEFGGSLFSACTSLTDISLPNGVEIISREMFSKCSSLKTIVLPRSLTKIESGAFQRCAELMRVEIPDTVVEIGENAFLYCSQLNTVTFTENSNLIDIGRVAFDGCELLSDFIIPKRVKTIGAGAFFGCSSLTEIEIPASVEEFVAAFWFEGCNMLTTITVARDNPTYHSSGNCLIETKTKTLIMGCKTSEIPTDGSVTKIGLGAFGSFLDLESIVIPKTIVEIGQGAFRGCSNFKAVYYCGTESEWESVNIDFSGVGYANEYLKAATVYFYSENPPSRVGNYWHDVDGTPTVW